MGEEIKLLEESFEKYNLDNRFDIDVQILNYIKSRILADRDLLEELIHMYQEEFDFDVLFKTFEEEINALNKYKEPNEIRKLDNGFAYGYCATSVGNIIVEVDNTLDALRYMVRAIRSRNSIVISDYEYDENNVSSALMIIFGEAIEKFGLNRNLIMYKPYEECFYNGFDRVLDDNNTIIKDKKISDNLCIYIQDEFFKDEVENELEEAKKNEVNVEVINGDFDNVISIINEKSPECATIYTKDAKLGYEFINLIKSNNVFFNSSVLNFEKMQEHEDKLYRNKKIMYPIDTISILK